MQWDCILSAKWKKLECSNFRQCSNSNLKMIKIRKITEDKYKDMFHKLKWFDGDNKQLRHWTRTNNPKKVKVELGIYSNFYRFEYNN